MRIEPINRLDRLVRVYIESGVEDMCVERRTSRRIRQVLRVLLLPLLQRGQTGYLRDKSYSRLTISLSHPKKNVRTSAYRATGCRTTRPMYLSKSPRRASTKSSLKRPAYCFSGSGGSAMPGRRRVNAVCRTTKCEKRRYTVMRIGEGGGPSSSSATSGLNSEVMEYMVYAPESIDVLFDGECTRMRNGGTLGFHAGPASTKCLSASLSPLSSTTELVLDCLSCPGVDGSSLSSAPCSTNSSAPLVTKLENLLSCFPPSKLLRKLGNHSPVVCGTRGVTGSSSCRVGDPRGVIDELEASLRLRARS